MTAMTYLDGPYKGETIDVPEEATTVTRSSRNTYWQNGGHAAYEYRIDRTANVLRLAAVRINGHPIADIAPYQAVRA